MSLLCIWEDQRPTQNKKIKIVAFTGIYMGALTYMANTFLNKWFIAKCSFLVFVNKTLFFILVVKLGRIFSRCTGTYGFIYKKKKFNVGKIAII